jgi:hypothetical protein
MSGNLYKKDHGQGAIGGYHHAYKSWGRTRGPKNIAGPPGTAVALIAAASSLRNVTTGYKTAGYATENQRYLHVLVTDNHTGGSDPTAITIFGYCHAFERWFEIPETEAEGEGQNTAASAASIDPADTGKTVALQAPSDREYRRYDICGIDRVAFVGDDNLADVFAACSTF